MARHECGTGYRRCWILDANQTDLRRCASPIRHPASPPNEFIIVAIIQALKDYETEAEERAFLRGVVQGLVDLEEGREMSLAAVKKRLGLS
jgi:hypothetical protein